MTKRLYVSSAIQAALLQHVLIPQMKDGFWKDHRPADHYKEWLDLEIVVTTDGRLGPDNFVVPRLYNFVNPEFIKPNERLLVSAAQQVKASSTFRSVKKELIELSRIVGGRLTGQSSIPTKANRGNNRPETRPAVAGSTVVAGAKEQLSQIVKEVKKTAVKKPVDGDVEVFKTSNGATVRRVKVSA